MQPLPLEVVVFGEVIAMFIADDVLPLELATRYTRVLADSEVNVALGLNQSGHHVGLITRLGSDPLGYYVLHTMQQAGVDMSRALLDDTHPTGFQLMSRVDIGDSQVASFRENSAASFMIPNAEDDAYLRRAQHLHFTGVPPALSHGCRQYTYHAIEQARTAGMSISFDPHLQTGLWKSQDEMREVLNDIATKVDIVLIGSGEGRVLTGYTTVEDAAKFYLDRGVKQVGVNAGANGFSLFTLSQRYDAPASSILFADTAGAGAGDSFVVGIISAMLEKLPFDMWLERSGTSAAIVPGD